MRFGIFARVANAPDVQCEIQVQLAARPSLDPLLDGRLLELYALTAVQWRRAIEAIEKEGLTACLTGYSSRLGAMLERLDRAIHEREKERIATMRRGPILDLSIYARKVEPHE